MPMNGYSRSSKSQWVKVSLLKCELLSRSAGLLLPLVPPTAPDRSVATEIVAMCLLDIGSRVLCLTCLSFLVLTAVSRSDISPAASTSVTNSSSSSAPRKTTHSSFQHQRRQKELREILASLDSDLGDGEGSQTQSDQPSTGSFAFGTLSRHQRRHKPGGERRRRRRKNRQMRRRMPSGAAADQLSPEQLKAIQASSFRGLRSSGKSRIIGRSQHFRKDWCKTAPLTQTISEKGCISKKIVNNYCYGQCNSLFIPQDSNGRSLNVDLSDEAYRRAQSQKGSHASVFDVPDDSLDIAVNSDQGELTLFSSASHVNDASLLNNAFKSCPYCKPKRFRLMIVRLNCPSLVPSFRRKKVLLIEKCRCLAA